ncbi:[protein-PII] uridylyltransferase [Methylophaga sp. 41_12_T18]|nr:[protein-PII] uridylyltransferase [Methylophaga sp. 41_12_T18]
MTSSIWQINENRSFVDQQHSTVELRTALDNSQSYLQTSFENGSDIVELVHQRAAFVDQVLQELWQQHQLTDCPISLLAVGGYGRGELHPYSDIDLLVLLDESVSEQPPAGLSDFLTQLWDIGLEIGHSVRTIQECRQQAEQDITIATNLLETRLLCGDNPLFSALQQLTITNKTWDTTRFYQDKKQEQIQRHLKYNDTANNLEPNIKESPGGLRDLQVISWVAQQHFGVQNLQGLKDKGFLENSEHESLDQAQRFLWKVRFALHNLAGRKEERLMIQHQRELAEILGYVETDNRRAVELFMRDFYRCARLVDQMNELLLQVFEENIILANEPRHITPINRRFQVHNGYLETINSGIFAFKPLALLELFLILQQHTHIRGVRANTIRQFQAHLHLIDKTFRADIKSKSLFMEIIRQPAGITHQFRRMNQFGILGAYLPEFGQIVGQMQHDLFHAYTVDEHTLFLVRNLRRFSCPEFSDEFPLCSVVFQQLPKPELLYIAGLYHDIAKGRGGDHSVLGMKDAEDFCSRHSLSNYDSDLVTFLVRNHLTMSATAQRSDINDPDVIKKFADLVQNVDRLNYLYLLTVADIRATNNNLWNGWRDSLLKQLYHGTKQWFEHKGLQAKNTAEKSEQKYQQALQRLIYQGVNKQTVLSLWEHYQSDYFLRHSVDEIVWQTTQRLKNRDAPTLVKIRNHNEQSTLEIFILTANKPGVFASITASIEQMQLDILDAKINTSSNGEALNTFIVGGNTTEGSDIISAIEARLAQPEQGYAYNPKIVPRTMKLFETEATIKFQTNEQQQYTVLELSTHDRPGLVSSVAQVFLQCEIQLINAKLTTLGDQVEDIFFITAADNQPLDSQQSTHLEESLISKLTKITS